MADDPQAPQVRRPFFQRLRGEILSYLADGTSPERLSWAMALGATGGLFPIYGLTTAVSAVIGIVFRANPIVIQVFNYMMYPIYFPIEFGFILAGAWFFEGNLDRYTWSGVREIILGGGLASTFKQIGTALIHAVIVWLAVAPFLAIGVRSVLLSLIRRWQRART